MSLYNTNFIEF